MMEGLRILDSSIADISVVASMPLLEVFVCGKQEEGRPSIKDLSPLASCPRLKQVWLCSNVELKDLSPLSSCTALEDLDLINCRLIASLAPLSNLKKLQKLECRAIDLRSRSSPLHRVLGLRS
jgi:Leucine-rich repeat (LRR) protein